MKNLCKIFFLCYMQRTEKVQDGNIITYIIQMNAFVWCFFRVGYIHRMVYIRQLQ